MNDSTQEEGGSGAERKRTRRKAPAPSTTPRHDRLPPHSIEAEQGVLGSILLCPGEAVSEAIEKLKGEEVFYDLRHQTIFNVLLSMYDSREPIDLITLPQKLRDTMVLDQVGGLDYLSSLPDRSPSAANVGYYAEIVREKYLLRKVVQLCTEVVTKVFEEEQDVDALLDEVERDILHVSQSRVSERKLVIGDLVKAAITQIEDFHLRQGMLSGVATGFRQLDKMTTGLHGGEMIVIAARPSMGKTSLAMNIAEYVAVEQQQPVGVFSLEMTADSLVLRMLCCRAKVNMRSVREGFLADRDFPKLTGAASKLSSAPIFIDDSSGLSILQLRAKARRMHQQHHIKLFVIDYLQLLHSTSKRAENRQQEIADISSGVKSLAKELNVPIIVLSQLNRELEKDKSRKPRMSDLRESGSIEQDADLIGLLYKPSSGDEEENAAGNEDETVAVNLLIAKQRNGPTGDVNLTFYKSFTRFESPAVVSEEDVPN